MNPSMTPSVHVVRTTADADPQKLVEEINLCLTDLSVWQMDARDNEETMHALWEGQSEDGCKHEEVLRHPAFPFEGAADTRQRLADMSVDELVMLQVMAFFGGEMRTVAMEANDTDAAGRVHTLLQFELKQRLASTLWEEMNYASQWCEGYGHAVVSVMWRKKWRTGKEKVNTEMLAELVLARMNAEAEAAGQPPVAILEDAMAIIEGFLMEKGNAEVVSLLQDKYPSLPEKRAERVVENLRKKGQDEFRVPVEVPGRPEVRALMPGFEVFYPWGDKVENAPWIAVEECYWEPDLLAKVRNEGWSQEFVDKLIELGPGRVVDQATLQKRAAALETNARRMFGRGAESVYARNGEMKQRQYAVLRVFLRAIDEDGVEALHEMVLNPNVMTADGAPILGLNQISDYYHEGGCFVSLRREYKTRNPWESRGVPQLAKNPQWELKQRRDAAMDRTSLNTLPPVRVPLRRAGAGLRLESYGIRPGGTVPSEMSGGAGNQVDFMRLPAYQSDAEIQAEIVRDNANLLGLLHPELSPEKIMTQRQWIVKNFLVQARQVVLRILALDQQFMAPIQVSRVIGSGQLPYAVTREEIAGSYDVMLNFDVRSLDMDWLKQRLQVLKEAVQFDRSGAFQDVPVMKYIIGAIDPNLADMAIADVQSARDMEAEDEKKAIGTLAAGVEIKPPQGANANVRLQTLQAELSQNPVINARYQQDPAFRMMIDRRAEKWQFDLQQRQNAQTGRDGWVPAMDEMGQ